MNTKFLLPLTLATGLGLGWLGHAFFESHPASDAHVHGEAEHEDHDQHAEGDHKEDPHADHAAEEGPEPGMIPDSLLAVNGISLDSAKPGSLSVTVQLPGRIVPDPARSATVSARFSGVVRTMSVRPGQRVRAGQLVATVESDASLQPYEIHAPRTGTVLHVDAAIGQTVTSGQSIAELADLSTVLAQFQWNPSQGIALRAGQSIQVLSESGSLEARAKVERILPKVDPATQARLVQASIPNPKGALAEGLFVQAVIETSRKLVNLTIPVTSLQTRNGATVVYVREGQAFEERRIEAGLSDGNRVEVVTGLKAGERVASQGSFVVKADLNKAEAGHEH
jgi:membrane fusion protein, heavy metal efflux system